MAKAIKRVGVIFFVVAIICLMAIGVLLGATSAKNNNNSLLDLNNKIEQASATSGEEIPTIMEEVLLDGATCEEQAAKWKEAIEKSLANGGNQHILVTMMNDWIAPNSGNHYFGTGTGFNTGRIGISTNTIITLDLNGYSINRRLSTAIEHGQIFVIDGGRLIIKDSKYDSLKVMHAYQNDVNANLIDYGAGKITGANNSGKGGAIYMINGTLTIESGMICNNHSVNGGAIYTQHSNINFIDGLISNNFGVSGGAMHINYQCTVNLDGGFIFKNDASSSGGAMWIGADENTTATINFTDGIISQNHAENDGGGVLLSNYSIWNMSGGRIEYNRAVGTPKDPCGGAICQINLSTMNITGGVIRKNTASCVGGAFYISGPNFHYISNCLITENENLGEKDEVNYGGAMNIYSTVGGGIVFGAGAQVYGNIDRGIENNVDISSPSVESRIVIKVQENLMKNNTNTHIGITRDNKSSTTGVFTSGYTSIGHNTFSPDRFFFSDKTGYIVTKNASGEAQLVAGTKPTSKITWKWENEVAQSTTNSNVVLPYTGTAYTISNNLNSLKNSNGQVASSYSVMQPGNYSFYVDGNYLNPTFMVTIEQPIARIEKPTNKEYAIVYNGKFQTFQPENFDSNTMEISYNIKKDVGKYTAKVRLKDAWKSTWQDNSTESLEYVFHIINPGIALKENSSFDYIYKDSNNIRQNYNDNKIIHKVSETETTNNYVIGNIEPKTTLKQFVSNIRKECGYIKIYNGNTLLYDGTTETEASDSIYVVTGYKVELYKNSNGTELLDTVYLSVLGDVVADGAINTMDVTFVNRIAKGEIKLEDLSIEQQLAAMVDNKGKVTSTDAKILLNVIGGNTETNDYFENVEQKDKYQILVLNKDNETGKIYRQNMNLTTLNVYDNAIIGNIAPNTKASEFKTKLATQTGANENDIEVHKANGDIAGDNDYIGTGCYINYNGNTIYLSVLGDLTGDGEVNTTDITYLNRIVNGDVKLNTNDIKDKLTMLSALIQNKGNVTTADSETLLNYIGGNADLTKYI